MKTLSKSSVVAHPKSIRTAGSLGLIMRERSLDHKVETLLLGNKHTANVLLTVLKFYEIGNARAFTPTKTHIELLGINHRVRQHGTGDGAVLKVSGRGPLNFHFIISPGSSKAVYYPVGIGFKLKKKGLGAAKELIARQTFASGAVHIYGMNLFFTDNYSRTSYGDLFSFYIVIQRGDGRIGIIDPAILHTNPPVGTPDAQH